MSIALVAGQFFGAYDNSYRFGYDNNELGGIGSFGSFGGFGGSASSIRDPRQNRGNTINIKIK